MEFFISENRVKDTTIALGNIDYKIINPIVKTNAEMWVHPILGSFFYEHLLTKYNAQTLSQNEEKVVKLIQNTLVWRVITDLVISSSAQLTNKGPQEQNGQNSNPSDRSKISMLTAHYQSKAEYFQNKLVHYLYVNKDLYAEYTDSRNNDCTVFYRPKKQKYNSNGVHFF